MANGSLGHERAMLWLGFATRLESMVQWGPVTLDQAGAAHDPIVEDWFGNLVVDAYAMRLLGYRTLAKARRGMEAAEQSILKLMGSEAGQAANLALVESLGPAALDPDLPGAPRSALQSQFVSASWWDLYLRSFAGTIAGGTSQIQRNIIAERVLGLPR